MGVKRLLGLILTLAIGITALAQTTTPSIVAPVINRALFLGTRGDDVKAIQQYLAQDKELYPEGLATGYFGKLTEAAVKRFQTKNGIEPVGIVGPKTRAKLAELAQVPAAPTPTLTPPVEEQPTATTAPTPPPPVLAPVGPLIKTGTGIVDNNRTFSIGPAKFVYTGGYAREHRGYLTPGDPAAFIANQTRSQFSACENVEIIGYQGISNICNFTDAANYTFTKHKEAVRLYDPSALIVNPTTNRISSCYQGILLFKQGDIYGAIDPENVDTESKLHYRYWYDESGGSNFSSLCASTQSVSAIKKELASVLESLISVLQKLREVVK